MSPPTQSPPSAVHPSQAVERIREILVGRQLDRLELRISRLENSPTGGAAVEKWEDRMCTAEARLEAMQQSLQRVSESQREEIQRIATQVQNVSRAAASAPATTGGLEQKIGAWLGQWQTALQTHLAQRDQRILSDIRKEVALLWENTEGEITRLKSQTFEARDIHRRLQGIADAARVLAEAASSPTPAER